MLATRILLSAALWAAIPISICAADGDVADLRQQAQAEYNSKNYDKSAGLYEQILKSAPHDADALYNAACDYALAGKKEQAVVSLVSAVENGFVNFAHLQHDSDLDSIRSEKGYLELLARRDKILAAYTGKVVAEYQKKLGGDYTVTHDDAANVVIISDTDAQTVSQLTQVLQAVSTRLWKSLFKHKPTSELLVIVPKNVADYFQKLGGKKTSAGFYNPGARTLTVNLATGMGTVVHEFTHGLHYADQEALGQQHPQWIVEGLGALYEQSGMGDGQMTGAINWRLPILKKAIADKKTFPLKDFLAKSNEYFAKDVSVAYAMTRYVCYFLQEKKLLLRFYEKYCVQYDQDKSGVHTLEEVYGKPVDEFEKDWLEFVGTLH